MQALQAATLYFGLAFGAGFILGIIRVLGLVPRVGERTAELMEAPIMLAVIFFAARWVVWRLAIPGTTAIRVGMGLTALGFLLIAEFGGVLWLRGLSLSEYYASRDPLAVAVYVVMLALFAVMPLIVARD